MGLSNFPRVVKSEASELKRLTQLRRCASTSDLFSQSRGVVERNSSPDRLNDRGIRPRSTARLEHHLASRGRGRFSMICTQPCKSCRQHRHIRTQSYSYTAATAQLRSSPPSYSKAKHQTSATFRTSSRVYDGSSPQRH